MDWWITFDQQAADYLPDLRIEKEEPMDRHTSFRIGGPARRMAFPERGEQLVLLLDMAARCGARPLVMGNGTNLLAPDEGLDRLVMQLLGADSLRDVIAFPKVQNASELMTECPAAVPEQALRELGITTEGNSLK